MKKRLLRVLEEAVEGGKSPVDMSEEVISAWQREGHPIPRGMMETFFVIRSSSDHLPIKGKENLWRDDVLEEKLKEKSGIDKFYRQEFFHSSVAAYRYLQRMVDDSDHD